VGPSGHLLEQCMHSAGMIRKECYILNLFPFQVVKRVQDGLTEDGELLWTKKGLTELGEGYCQSSKELLQKCKANVVVPLGNVPLEFCVGHQSITKWRGSILMSTFGKKVVPTIHPAASLRGQYLWRYLIISDLKRAKEESEVPEMNLPQRELLIDPTFNEVLDFLRGVSEKKRFATDIECLNHQISCMSFAPLWDLCMSVPFLNSKGGHRWTLWEEAEIWTLIAELMGNKDIMKINQNIIFDIGFLLRQNNIITRGELGDPGIAHHIIFPDFRWGLDLLCSLWTREPYYKDDGKLWSKPWLDMDTFWRYNAKDSCVALEVWDALQDELDNGYRETFNRTVNTFDSLLYMMTGGMKIDRDHLEETKIKVKSQLAEKEKKLLECAERDFNPGSSKQCIEYFYVTKGIKPYISTKTGQPTTDDKAMARIVRRFNLPEARLVQDIRGLRKLISTYLEVKSDEDGRIRSSYNPRGTWTGRLSSSQTIFGTGMNMQNLDPRFKGFLVAD